MKEQQQSAKTAIEVDRSRCIAIGLCEAASPKYFEVGDDGKLVILQTIVDSGDLAEVEDAIASCPTSALRFAP